MTDIVGIRYRHAADTIWTTRRYANIDGTHIAASITSALPKYREIPSARQSLVLMASEGPERGFKGGLAFASVPSVRNNADGLGGGLAHCQKERTLTKVYVTADDERLLKALLRFTPLRFFGSELLNHQ
jgi:hypothetical protein